MTSYKVTYFDMRGLGEVVRQLLALADQPFEDERVTFEQWPERQKTTPFGLLPVLEVDGKQLPQSFAIARFLARKHGGISSCSRGRPPEDLPFLEKQLVESKSGFFVGDGLTWIDVFVADHVDVLVGLIPGFLDEYPKVLAHCAKIRSEPKLKAYLDKRPASKC